LPRSGPADGPFFAVDVGASWVKSGRVADGHAEDAAREPVARGLEALVAQIARLRDAADADTWGLCVAGLVDAAAGTLRYSANLDLRDAPLVELLAATGHAPAVFANDLDAAAVGEAGGGTLALLQVGTGIAGRYVVDGRVVPSASGHGGEVGHLRFRDGGIVCSCGNRGCAEAYGSWGGITRRNPEAAEPTALPADVVADAQEAIGFAAAALVATCDPGTLRVGGGLAAAWGETLLEGIRAALRDRVLPELASGTTVETARLGDTAPLIGLAALRSGAPPAPRSS
jgi:glucokinase